MKKSKPDYFRIIENISKSCLYECENISAILNNKNTTENIINSLDELISLTDILRKEYLTPIEREDIFSIASHLHKLNSSLKTICSDLKKTHIYSTDMIITLNILLSAVTETDNCVKYVINNNKSDIYSSAFKTIRCAEKGLSAVKNISVNNLERIILSIQKSLYYCYDLSDRIIYIYLKNT